MTREEFMEALRKLPAGTEVVCGSLSQPDQYIRAAPWSPEEVAIAGLGVKRAIVIGADLANPPNAHRERRFRNQVVPRGRRKGIGGHKAGTPWRKKVGP